MRRTRHVNPLGTATQTTRSYCDLSTARFADIADCQCRIVVPFFYGSTIQAPIQLHSRTHVSQRVMSFIRSQWNAEVLAECSELEIRGRSQVRPLLKEPESSMKSAEDSEVGWEVQLLPLEPFAKERAVEGRIVGDEASLPELLSVSTVSARHGMTNQELAKTQRDFSRRTSLPIPPPSVIVSARQGSFRRLVLIELQLCFEDLQRSTSAVNGDCGNLHDGPPRLLAGCLEVNKDKATGKPPSTGSPTTTFVYRFATINTIRHF